MEPAKGSMRAILPLLKARVIERGPGRFVIGFGAEYGSPTQITVMLANMEAYDLREGDVLTLYTEVLLAQPKGSA